jgi:hypothetical protein
MVSNFVFARAIGGCRPIPLEIVVAWLIGSVIPDVVVSTVCIALPDFDPRS